MSIINDALKKTQMSLKGFKKDQKKEKEAEPAAKKEPQITNVYEKMYQEKQIKENVTGVPLTPGSRPSKSGPTDSLFVRILKFVGALAFLIVSLMICFMVVSKYKPVKNFIRTIKSKSRASQFRSVINKPVKKRIYKSGDLILNGTSLVDGRRAALINDEIYEVGDMIKNREVTEIGSDFVELRDDKEIITIKVR